MALQVRAEESATSAQEVQVRFVIVVQAVDSYSVPEQAKGSHIGVGLQILLVLSQ